MDNSNSMKSSPESGSLFNSFFSSSAEAKPAPGGFKLGSGPGSPYLPQGLYSGSSATNDSSWIIYLIGGVVLLSILGAIAYYYYLQQQGKVPPMMQLGQSYLAKLSNQFSNLASGTTSTQPPSTIVKSAEPVNTQEQYNEQIEQQQNELNQTLNSAQVETQVYEADESSSSIQASKAGNKSGWCYIGEDRGFRSCIKVGEQDTCMSGDIFPSQDICVNPSLRQ
jgi:hypothetical protein